MARAGRSVNELAREFEPSANAIRYWLKQAGLDEGLRSDGLTTDERVELRLRRGTGGCVKKVRAWQKRRPGSRRRPAQCRHGVPIRECESGDLRGCQHVPGPGCLRQRLLCVAPAATLSTGTADVELCMRIRAIHQYSRGTYGAPRIPQELRAAESRVGCKRVARWMQAVSLRGASRRPWVITTVRDRHARPAPELVERNFTAAAPDCWWVADITYIPTWAGFLYLAVVLDTFSRRIVGWAMATHLRTELVLEALNMAIGQRPPAAVIHHSDQGSQDTALAFGQRCEEAGVRPSMASVGDCFDNAMCESFFATLECELLDRRHFKTPIEAPHGGL